MIFILISVVFLEAAQLPVQSSPADTSGDMIVTGIGTTRKEATEDLRSRIVENLESHHHASLGEHSQLIDLEFLAGLGAITSLTEVHRGTELDGAAWEATAKFHPNRAKIQDLLIRARMDLRQFHLKIAAEFALVVCFLLVMHDRFHAWQIRHGFKDSRSVLWKFRAGFAAAFILVHIFLHGGILIHS